MRRSFAAAPLALGVLALTACSTQLTHEGDFRAGYPRGSGRDLPHLVCPVTIGAIHGLDQDPAPVHAVQGNAVALSDSVGWVRDATNVLGFQDGPGAPGSVRLELRLISVSLSERTGIFSGGNMTYGEYNSVVVVDWSMISGDVATNGTVEGRGLNTAHFRGSMDLGLRDALQKIHRIANAACDGANPDL
jgi:hypothetical protein